MELPRVAKWRLQSAKSPDAASKDFVDFQEAEKDGFETTSLFDGLDNHFVRALALDGEEMCWSHEGGR